MQPSESQTIWLDVEGMRVHCLTSGEGGVPIVLLHGGGVDSATLSWGEIIGRVALRHQIFAPDLPGYGQTEKPDIQYTMEFYIQFVEHLLEELKLDRVSLVGQSLGGAIALGLTLDAPERVEKLVLVDTYGIQDKAVSHRLAYLYVHLPGLAELSNWLMGKNRALVRWVLLAGIIYNPAHLSEELVDQCYQAVREKGAGKAFLSLQRSEVGWHGVRSNFTPRLCDVTVPTLLVHGAEDRSVPLACAKRAHALIAGSQLYVMQECRHWPQGENPDEFSRVMEGFLED